METYIPITYLNDFIFCPRSIYFHQCYGKLEQRQYYTVDQERGKIAHKSVDNGSYSTSKSILQGIEVYSDKYNIAGKIDIYYKDKEKLVERKRQIKVIYDGYIYQLYAQYHCLIEMGYVVNNLSLYSMIDNKSYQINLPENDIEKHIGFERLIHDMKNFDLSAPFDANANKCSHCIYNNLCDRSLYAECS